MKLSFVEQMSIAPGKTAFDALDDALANAVHAESLGFHRMWFAEHHGLPAVASQAPEVLMGVVARQTRRLRIGSGGILLNNYSPFKVAELFMQLELLAPGRFDLGLGRATSGQLVDLALQRDRRSRREDDFAQQVQEVMAFLHQDFPDGHPFERITLMPTVKARPEPWILGSSGSSVDLAAGLGIGYSFAGFLNPNGAARALRRYRQQFRPTRYGAPVPQSMLSLCVFVADTDAEARRLTWPTRAVFAGLHRAAGLDGFPTIEQAERLLSVDQRDAPALIKSGVWPAQLAGTRQTLQLQLEQMIDESGADEILLQTISPDQESRRRMHETVAEILGASAGAIAA